MYSDLLNYSSEIGHLCWTYVEKRKYLKKLAVLLLMYKPSKQHKCSQNILQEVELLGCNMYIDTSLLKIQSNTTEL